jgi:hypothetical protein
MEKKEIIIVEWTLDDIMGELKRISLVSEPAIEADFMLFSQEEMKFKAVDEEKRVLTGPAMRPNIKIKRYNELGELYYGVFTEDVVRQAAEMFFKKGSNVNKTNLEHEFEIDGVYVFESWIVDNPDMDKSKELGFTDVKKGDWFVSMKVDNDVVWNNYLKTGLIKGFSVEIRADEKEIDTIEMIKAVLDLNKTDEWKFEAITTLVNEDFIDIVAKPYVDETGKIIKEPVEGIENFESYDDYPEAAKRNAQIALDWAEKNGWGSCGTSVGKQRANQLAKGEPISEETIARMAAFERHRQNSQKELGDGCGRLMWQAWGGDEGVEWASRKLEQIRRD